MNRLRALLGLLLAAWIFSPPATAQTSEPNRYYIQQMIELAAANDEHGVTTTQQVLAQSPKPKPINPDGARSAVQRGMTAFEQNQLETALAAFQQASQADPSNIEATNYLGLVYRKLNRLQDAEIALQQALALEPTRATAWFQLAQVYGLQNDGRRAVGALANTYRFAQNAMRAEEILRNIAENEAADTLRNAALETLRLYKLPAQAVIVPPLPADPGITPLKIPAGSSRARP
ncbi:MAG: tetratricopeptide repeat protein [Candidatus Competibacteraceae bacterium]|nr:tetratricopeptide repeat protein [Candidatus Competibacteraceae bacterium]